MDQNEIDALGKFIAQNATPMTTTPTDAQMKLADVTQADREAADGLCHEATCFDCEYELLQAFARHRQATEARAQGLVEAERTSWGVMCGSNPSQIPADMVGCGKPIMGPSQTYRCTHCDVPFHKVCAEKHFQSDNVLTEEMVEEIERREAIRHSQHGGERER